MNCSSCHHRSESSTRLFRKGLTLIEVVCGLALSATLLSSLLVAHSQHARQIRMAADKLHAIEALDAALMQVQTGEIQFEENNCLEFEHTGRWRICRRMQPATRNLKSIDCRVQRMEIRKLRDGQATTEDPLTFTEILVLADND